MNEALGIDEAVAAAKRVIAMWGEDFRYSDGGVGACSYVPQSHPLFPSDTLLGKVNNGSAVGSAVAGCLVGEILSVTDRMTDEIASAVGPIEELISTGVVSTTPAAGKFLRVLQEEQDNGTTWGGALAAALRVVATMERNDNH